MRLKTGLLGLSAETGVGITDFYGNIAKTDGEKGLRNVSTQL